MSSSTPDPEPIRHGSEVHIDEWVAPDACDDAGVLRAGKILEWMDVVGALAASRYTRQPAVTVSIDGGTLLGRVAVGERVTMRARVAHTSRRTIGLAVTMEAGAALRPVLRGYMTFVVLGDDGRPAAVPAFVPQTPEEIALNDEGELRRQFHRELASRREICATPEALIAPERTDSQVLHLLRTLGMRLAGKRVRVATRMRTPADSYVHRIEPVRAGKLNFHGTLYGGTLMRWIETCAAMSARAHADAPVQLLGFEGISFLRPVPANVFVHLTGTAAHADDLGVTIHVRATAEDPLTGSTVETLRGFLAYTPIDRTLEVPGLLRTTADEGARYCEVLLRHGLRARILNLAPSRRAGSGRASGS